jgi:predicted metal-dependent hydrolase
MSEKNTTTEGTQGSGTQTDEKKSPAVQDPKSDTQAADQKKAEEKTDTPKTFTQEEVNAFLAKERRDLEKKAKEADDRAKLSDDERIKSDLESLRRENQLLKAESDVGRLLKEAGARSPELLFAASKDRLVFDKDGKLSNAAELVAELKLQYSDQFGIMKPKETIDGGAGDAGKSKKAETLSAALQNHYSNNK